MRLLIIYAIEIKIIEEISSSESYDQPQRLAKIEENQEYKV